MILTSAEAGNEGFNFTRLRSNLSQNVAQNHEVGLGLYQDFFFFAKENWYNLSPTLLG